MVTKRLGFFLGVVVLSLLSTSSALYAQSISLGQALGHTEEKKSESSYTMFTYLQAGYTPLNVTYTGTNTNEDWINNAIAPSSETYTYDERSQRITALSPNFGIRFDMPSRVSFSVSFGASYLKLEERQDAPLANTDYRNYHSDFYTYKPNAGFSTSLGLDWEMVRFKRISGMLGLQFQYLSTYGLKGHSVTGNINNTAGGINSYDESNTTDLSLHLFNIQPHIGIEWRPFQSFVVNSFGVFGTMMLSAASMEKTTRFVHTDTAPGGAQTTRAYTTSKQEIDVSVQPVQFLGAFYAWHFAIPHFGSLGFELQFGSQWNAILAYQYMY